LVVAAPLLTPADSADGGASVEEFDRFLVLALAVLDDETVPGPVPVDG